MENSGYRYSACSDFRKGYWYQEGFEAVEPGSIYKRALSICDRALFIIVFFYI